jgi:hypothetical protein
LCPALERGELVSRPWTGGGDVTIDQGTRHRIIRMILDVLREVAAECGTGHIGSEHVAMLAVRGAGGLAELTGLPPDDLATALRRECRLARETPPDRPTLTPRTGRLVHCAMELAELRGEPAPTAAELVGALLNEPGCEAWRDLASLGVTERQVELAQRAAFADRLVHRRPSSTTGPAVEPPGA